MSTAQEEKDRELFNNIARRFARKDVIPSSAIPRARQLLGAVGPIIEAHHSLGTVVDIGCGVGAPAMHLRGHYERYVGIDHSDEMIRVARSLNEGNPRAEFLAENVKSADIPAGTADLILSLGALHHMTALEDVMVGLQRIAKPGAHLVVIEPLGLNPVVQLLRSLRSVVDPAYSSDQAYFSPEELYALVRPHVQPDVRIEGQGFFSAPFAHVVMGPQFIFESVSRSAVFIDEWLDRRLPIWLKRFAFNVVIQARFV